MSFLKRFDQITDEPKPDLKYYLKWFFTAVIDFQSQYTFKVNTSDFWPFLVHFRYLRG